MPHHIYQTRAFVIGSSAYGEADRMVFLFTESLGLVRGVAKSVRSAKSKLRYSLQDGAFLRVNLVRGKEVWRVTDAEEIARFSPLSHSEKARAMAGIFALLRRFVHGEERDEKTFRIVENAFAFLQSLREKNGNTPTEKVFGEVLEEILKNFEILAALRILHALGYVESEEFMDFLEGDFSRGTLAGFSSRRSAAIRGINRAIAESHL